MGDFPSFNIFSLPREYCATGYPKQGKVTQLFIFSPGPERHFSWPPFPCISHILWQSFCKVGSIPLNIIVRMRCRVLSFSLIGFYPNRHRFLCFLYWYIDSILALAMAKCWQPVMWFAFFSPLSSLRPTVVCQSYLTNATHWWEFQYILKKNKPLYIFLEGRWPHSKKWGQNFI